MPLTVGASINIPRQVSIWVWDIWRFLFPLIHPRVLIGLFAIYLILSLKGVIGFVCAEQTQGSTPAKSTPPMPNLVGNKSHWRHKQHQYFACESSFPQGKRRRNCGQILLHMISCARSLVCADFWQRLGFSHCFTPTSFSCNSAKISRNWLKLGDLVIRDPRRSLHSLIQVIQMWNQYLHPLQECLEAKFTRVWKALCDPRVKNIKCTSTGGGSGTEYSSL